MIIQEVEEILKDQAHIFQDIYFESSQIHPLTIMYFFEYTNHDILIIFFLKTLRS